MKQLIKSAIVYNAELPSPGALQSHLESAQFVEPLSLQTKSVGFVPRTEGSTLVEAFAGGLSFTVRIDQKIIPASVVKAELVKRVKDVERVTGRKPGKKERAELKLAVLDEIARRALIRTTLVTCFHHTATNMLIVPTTNPKLAGTVVSDLVNAVGSVKTTTIHVSHVQQGLTTRLKKWLADDETAFAGLHPCGEAGLAQDTRKVTVKMGDLASARSGLNEALSSGFEVKSLGFLFSAGTEVKLTDEFRLRGISFAHPPCEGDDGLFEAEAALEVQEISSVVTFLCEMFGYQEAKPEPTPAA